MTVVRMADKVIRNRLVPHLHWRFLPGLVNLAYIISAMMTMHPEANPSPRLLYTEQKQFNESY